MKFKLFCILSVIFSVDYISAQDISTDKLISYAKLQNLKIINADLEYKGFITKLEGNVLAAVKNKDSKIISDAIYATFNTSTFSICNTSFYFSKKKKEFLSKNLTFIELTDTDGILGMLYDNPTEKYGVIIVDKALMICLYTKL
jgi:hypothetical protein